MRDYVYIDDHFNAMKDLTDSIDNWRTIAEKMYEAFMCEKTLRDESNVDSSGCEKCTEAVKNYWAAVRDDEK